MDAAKLRLFLAAPLSGLFLALILLCFIAGAPNSSGFSVPLFHLGAPRTDITCDGQFELVQLLPGYRTRINTKEISANQLKSRVAELMQDRAERVVYLAPSSEVDFGRVAMTFDSLKSAAEGMHVILLSGRVRDTYIKEHRLPCDLIGPGDPRRSETPRLER
jgi:biopolymer transport protein ExbD